MTGLTLYYRGPLSSCNYSCTYCPFAKAWEEQAVLDADRAGLERFVAWARDWQGAPLSILFTPWGKALVRKWYRDAMVELSHLPQVRRVAAQTNLSMKLDWLGAADLDTLALWTTWHPTQCSRERFLRQCGRLDLLGVRYSVGVVGLKEHFEELPVLAAQLRAPLWINAYKREPNYYSDDQRAWLQTLDPRFADNQEYRSLGEPCFAGETHFTVDGSGTVRRCHFIDAPLGNLYEEVLDTLLAERACSNTTCRRHIGYLHLKELQLYRVYGEGLMERIPAAP